MILRYQGYWVKTTKKFRELRAKDKMKFFKEFFSQEKDYIVERVKEYWLGTVKVIAKEIYGDEAEIYQVMIFCTRRGRMKIFQFRKRETVEKIVDDMEKSGNGKYILSFDFMDGGEPTKFLLRKEQKEEIKSELEKLMKQKWYDGEGFFGWRIGNN